MSKKANPTLVGTFVLLGLLLGVAGVLVFSSVKLFASPQRFILYFEGSVKGLNPGAAVMVNGVKVGTVREVLIRLNQRDDDNAMPVIIEVDESILRRKSDRVFGLDDEEALQSAIERGLRARLEAESLVTGILYVELGFHPDAEPPVYHQVEPLLRELPTQPNTVQALLANLAGLDMAGLSDRLDSVLQRMDEGLGELNVAQLNQSVTNLLGSMQALITSPGLTNAVTDIDKTVVELRDLSASLRTRLPALSDSTEATLEELKRTAADVQQTSEQLRAVLAPNSPLAHGLIETVSDLGDASRALKDLAEYLQRNPNAVLSGRARPDHAP
jgi:paraquat-inducible protein B